METWLIIVIAVACLAAAGAVLGVMLLVILAAGGISAARFNLTPVGADQLRGYLDSEASFAITVQRDFFHPPDQVFKALLDERFMSWAPSPGALTTRVPHCATSGRNEHWSTPSSCWPSRSSSTSRAGYSGSPRPRVRFRWFSIRPLSSLTSWTTEPAVPGSPGTWAAPQMGGLATATHGGTVCPPRGHMAARKAAPDHRPSLSSNQRAGTL